MRLYAVVNRWSEDYELESYRCFKNHEGQKFYTTGVKTWKTDSAVIEYTENNMVHYGRVRMFLKLHNKGIWRKVQKIPNLICVTVTKVYGPCLSAIVTEI